MSKNNCGKVVLFTYQSPISPFFSLISEQRINVALTRSKRVLRIVGDLEFWSNGSSESVLRKLAVHCKEQGLVWSREKSRTRAWMKPNLSDLDGSLWKANMTGEPTVEKNEN